jgi:dTMP kinase
VSKGYLITFEGLDGTGKTLQVQKLSEYLTSRGRDHICVREPGGSPVAEALRKIVKESTDPISKEAELLIFGAARAQVVASVIKPALEAGKVVLCDRYIDSTVAYQCFARGNNLAVVKAINDISTNRIDPDLTILLVASPEIRKSRIDGRDGASDRFDKLGADFFQKVSDGYAWCEWSYKRIRSVDANAEPDEVAARVLGNVEFKLPNLLW